MIYNEEYFCKKYGVPTVSESKALNWDSPTNFAWVGLLHSEDDDIEYTAYFLAFLMPAHYEQDLRTFRENRMIVLETFDNGKNITVSDRDLNGVKEIIPAPQMHELLASGKYSSISFASNKSNQLIDHI